MILESEVCSASLASFKLLYAKTSRLQHGQGVETHHDLKPTAARADADRRLACPAGFPLRERVQGRAEQLRRPANRGIGFEPSKLSAMWGRGTPPMPLSRNVRVCNVT